MISNPQYPYNNSDHRYPDRNKTGHEHFKTITIHNSPFRLYFTDLWGNFNNFL